MAVSLESDIDGLYRLPLSEFTAARNALAKRVGGDEGKRVRALVKPAAVPGIVNRLYWRERPVYERLLKTGADLRTAQLAVLGGRRPDGDAQLGRATTAHRKALAEAVRRAARLGTRAGDGGARSTGDDLTRMLEAVSLAPTHPETRGRLTVPVSPAGFEALAGVTSGLRIVRPSAASLQPHTTVTKPRAVRAGAEPSSAEFARRQRERDRLEEQARCKRGAAIAAASRTLARTLSGETRAKAALDRAYAALERARDERQNAEQILRRLKSHG